MDRTEQRKRAERLRALHHGARILVLVNVWDVASALVVQQAGLPALATSSSAVSSALGYPDGERIAVDEVLSASARIAARVSVPLSADLEGGYARALDGLTDIACRLIDTGAVGLNLEDSVGATGALLDMPDAVKRVRAVRRATDEAGVPLVINARTDVFLEDAQGGKAAYREAVRRLSAYREAGADCLFPIGVRDAATIEALVRDLEGPVNILAGPGAPTIPELHAMGVARVSLGGGPQRAALRTLANVAGEATSAGTYASLEGAFTHRELDDLVAATWPDGGS
jgi:2-methylisocitrate lyase-like PEP mutase family enzyme